MLVLCSVPAAGAARRDGRAAAPIHPWVLQRTAGGATTEFFVILKERARIQEALRIPGPRERRRFVWEALRSTARRTQAPLLDWLDAHGIPSRPYFIVNAVLVRGDRRLAETLARRDDVLRIEGNPVVHNELPLLPAASALEVSGEPEIPWGIRRTGAPELWALGITGEGIVVGGQDTGVDWTHPALRGQYRGWDGAAADHDFNWHDAIHDAVGNPCGSDSPEPCDDSGHGTHTMGTAVGDDGAGKAIGMAPGARWIACRNMDQGNGSPSTYLECMEWFLAPWPVGGDPSQGNPDLGPDVTVNSWTCPPSEGCSWDTLRQAVLAQRAAGIFTVAAAGNEGPGCGTVQDPPGIYASAFSVGATDANDLLADFSSRGPAATNRDDPGLLKPDLVAPGVGVLSAVPGGFYVAFNGTSMATPHVAGAVALLWSARPWLRNSVEATVSLLERSATPLPDIVENCGGDFATGPNNSWGHGLLDVPRALSLAVPPPRRPRERVEP